MGRETLFAPRQEQESSVTFSAESLIADIEAIRADMNVPDLAEASPKQRETFLRGYLEAIDEARRETLTLAEQDGLSPGERHRINATYGAEIAHAWEWYATPELRKRLADIRLKLVEWQHAAQRFLLGADEREAARLWSTYHLLFFSQTLATPRGAGEDITARYWALRAGILGPVGVAAALRGRNSWDVGPPDDPEDDEKHAVDLVSQTPDGQTILVQVETVGQHGELAWERVPETLQERTAWKKTADLQRGRLRYIEKYRLDPRHVHAVSVRIPMRSLDEETGLPEARASGRLSKAVAELFPLDTPEETA